MAYSLVEGDMNVFELRGYTDSQLDGPRRHLALIASLRQELMQRPRAAADSARLLAHALDRARLSNALGAMDGLREALSDAAAFAAAMTIRERVSGGEVELATRDRVLAFPGGGTDAAIPLWLDGLACAVIARDSAALAYLANPIAADCVARAAERSARPIGNEPFWPMYARAFIALVQDQPIAAAHAREAAQYISIGSVGALVREALAITDMPVLRLIQIVASGAKSDWPAALQAALTSFHEHFADPARAHNLSGYLPLLMLAVCRLAIDRGFSAPPSSPYLPSTLLQEVIPGAQTQLAVRYPRRAILSADEAHWFLDLQGFARSGRTHRLVDEDNDLVAQYEVQASGGLSPAFAEFTVVDQHAVDEDVAFALDAGQLLFLAQSFASHVPANTPADLSTARVLLDDAIGCVDAVLARIPKDSDRVPPETICSEEGSAILAAEPDRFSRARLNAYREGLKAQLAASSAKDTNTAGDVLMGVLENAQRSIDMIRAEAMPLLDALARDADGSIVATLRPREGDYEKVFQGDAIARARAVYEQLWSGDFAPPRPRSTQTEIRCAVAPAGMLTWSNELSRRFPGGYEGIAASLNPHRVWLAWQYIEPGQPSGLSFDGLVWVDDHWVWLPKPYRYLRSAS